MITEFEIQPRDLVEITSQGVRRKGFVDTVYRWNGSYNIELRDPIHGAVYWKQNIDGGTVRVVIAKRELRNPDRYPDGRSVTVEIEQDRDGFWHVAATRKYRAKNLEAAVAAMWMLEP